MTTIVVTPTKRRARWRPWLALGLLLATAALLYGAIDTALAGLADTPLRLVIDGEEVFSDLQLGPWTEGQKLAVVAVLLGLLLVCALLLPLLLLVVLLLVGGVVLLSLGLPLLVLVAVLAVVGSPLLLLGLLLYALLRRASPPRGSSATIAG